MNDDEAVPPQCAAKALDMEANQAGRLVRVPGVFLQYDEPHSLRYIFEQASIDYSTELVAVDPPYLGVKSIDTWAWYNAGIGPTGPIGWNVVNYGGTLLVSNGVDFTFSRDPGATVIVDRSAVVIARTFAVQFGRLFAASFISLGSGQWQSIGVQWNSSVGDYSDFSGIGSGAELLIDQQTMADRIVALRSIGYDVLGIVMRKSLWAGYRNNDPFRPADFRPRINGLGAVSEATVVKSPAGITLLSDEGVVNYDINNATVISGDINSELLPLDYSQIDRYRMLYQPIRRRIYLQTPFCCWVYDFPADPTQRGRWWQRSIISDNMVAFTDQATDLRWSQLVGTWDEQALRWSEFQQTSEDSPSKVSFVSGSKMGQEDPTVLINFTGATPLMPTYQTGLQAQYRLSDIVETLELELEYKASVQSLVRFTVRDEQGNWSKNISKLLDPTAGALFTGVFQFVAVGQAVQLQIEIMEGDAEIAAVRQIISDEIPQTRYSL